MESSAYPVNIYYIFGVFWEFYHQIALSKGKFENIKIFIYEDFLLKPEETWSEVFDYLNLVPTKKQQKEIRSSVKLSEESYSRRNRSNLLEEIQSVDDVESYNFVMQGLRAMSSISYHLIYNEEPNFIS